jgi:opacity protein-like surface antigen
MKKLNFVLFVASMFFTTNAFAHEKNDIDVGGHLLVAGAETKLFGFGINLQSYFSDKIRLDGSFSYFLPHTDDYYDITLNMWNISANIHWLIGRNNFKFYPLIGLGTIGISEKAYGETEKETYAGLNLGFGFEYILSEKLAINLEYRNLTTEIGNTFHAMLGLSYKIKSNSNSNNNRYRYR